MIEAMNLTVSAFFSVLNTWLNIEIPISSETSIKLRTILIFLWLLWFSLQVIHMFTHIHSDSGGAYNGRH